MLAIMGYAFKRVSRSWKLFVALLASVITASSFFAGINISIDNIGFRSLQQQLEQVYADIVVASPNRQILSSQNITDLRGTLLSIKGVKNVDIISKIIFTAMSPKPVRILLPDGSSISLERLVDVVIGVSRGSYIYRHMVFEGEMDLDADEVLVEAKSTLAPKLKVGDVINVTIPIVTSSGTDVEVHCIERSLRVSGYVTIDDPSYLMSLGIYSFPTALAIQPSIARRIDHNIIFINWEETFANILNEAYAYKPSYSPIITYLLVNLDRDSLLNPWDIDGSRSNMDKVVSTLTNTIRTSYGEINLQITNNLGNALRLYEVFSTFMMLQGVILSVPVFFISWYLGLSVSDLSFNIRRREIGLLLSKGFTERHLLGIFLAEASLIGIIGAVMGLILGVAFTPLFSLGQVTGLPILQSDTFFFTIAFSIIITFLSVFQPARKAAKLKPVEALSEYFSVEIPKPHRKIWVWLAFGLGAYKIVMLILGLSLNEILPPASSVLGGRGGFLAAIVLFILRFTDNILLYIAPVLFFWGFTKIFIAQSLSFHEALIKITSPLIKDLRLLAERNMQRNAARVASTAFLLSLIVGYAVSSFGQVATQSDYTRRLIYENVGSDIGVLLNSTDIALFLREKILSGVEGIESVTVEYRGFTGQTALGADDYSSTQLAAINPEEWLKAAYYEDEWFIGGSAEQIIKSLSNNTIILEGRFSDYISIGDNVSIVIGGKNFNLIVAGFYGPSSADISGLPQAQQIRLRLISRSLISERIYTQVKKNVSSRAYLLIKLKPNANVDKVVSEIRSLPGVEWVTSAFEQIKLRSENFLLSGALNISQLGVFFSVIAASIGSALVTLVSLMERRKEITLLMVRGFSPKQVVSILLAESLSTLLLSILVGGFVGYLVHRGNVSSSAVVAGVVTPRIIFPLETIINLIVVFTLLASSTIIPVVIMVTLRSNRLVWRE